MDELLRAIKKGKPNKAPGQDGISLDFFQKTIDLTKRDLLTIMNNMYIDGQITENQNVAFSYVYQKQLAQPR